MPSIERASYHGRGGVWLKTSSHQLFVQADGGMCPEFSIFQQSPTGMTPINAYWNPHFRGIAGSQFEAENPQHADYWHVKILHEAAGTFPCAPTFGAGGDLYPPHGETANQAWHYITSEVIDSSLGQIVAVYWEIEDTLSGFNYQKWDWLIEGHSAHYMMLGVRNRKPVKQATNLAWHTTLGQPLLAQGCDISCSSMQYQVCPSQQEFDDTGRLFPDARFTDLSDVPLRDGSRVNMSSFDVNAGATDLVCGAIHPDHRLEWSACSNSALNLGFISLIPKWKHPEARLAHFFNFWYQQGGRHFTPWADYDGGPDRSLALGMEASIGGFANGLQWSLDHPEVLQQGSYVMLQSNQRVLFPCINLLIDQLGARLGDIRLSNSPNVALPEISLVMENKSNHQQVCDIRMQSFAEITDQFPQT
ncbi:hypothetical protein DBZ36_18145 [Alginatibacterium sediminis]|uniref:DUF4432 family protein n=1 Tax=Alginatibacterium sediminis TaxID=2164068 RepID=A0A420E6S9_9ALTE|nr:hypothetical protein [Alginatibacterium sediminis]RKF13693.1 hypothetical protein DBZ36_18145 [Alginatibacterium sediminis]